MGIEEIGVQVEEPIGILALEVRACGCVPMWACFCGAPGHSAFWKGASQVAMLLRIEALYWY